MRTILIALLMTLATHTSAETFEGKEAEMLIRKGKILSSVPYATGGMQLLVETDGRLHLSSLNAPASFSTDTSTSSLEALTVARTPDRGPRTTEGKARIAAAHYRLGRRSKKSASIHATYYNRLCQNKPPCPTVLWKLASEPCPILYPSAISKPAQRSSNLQ